MAFENDPEGYRLARGYAGHDFDKPRMVQHELLTSYTDEWTLDEFQKLIADLGQQIPPQYRDTAKVFMYDPGYDGPQSLRIEYTGPETPDMVADRVRRCEEYVANKRAEERATFERLKAKFG
jgi:hypothetical protein